MKNGSFGMDLNICKSCKNPQFQDYVETTFQQAKKRKLQADDHSDSVQIVTNKHARIIMRAAIPSRTGLQYERINLHCLNVSHINYLVSVVLHV